MNGRFVLAAENNGSLFGTLWPALHSGLSAPVRRSTFVAPAIGDDRREWNGEDIRARCLVSSGIFRAGKTEFVDFGTVGSCERTDLGQGRGTRTWNHDGGSGSRTSPVLAVASSAGDLPRDPRGAAQPANEASPNAVPPYQFVRTGRQILRPGEEKAIASDMGAQPAGDFAGAGSKNVSGTRGFSAAARFLNLLSRP